MSTRSRFRFALTLLALCSMLPRVRAQDAWPPLAPNSGSGGDATLSSTTDTATLRAQKSHVAAELAAAQKETEAVSVRLKRDGRALYRLKRSGLLPLSGGVSAMLGHASRIGRLERVVENDAKARTALLAHVSQLDAKQIALDGQLAKAERDGAILDAARANAERQSFMSAFSARAPKAPEVSGRDLNNYGLSLASGAGSNTERFVEQRGQLALPISGSSRIEDATRAESDGSGLALSAERGASVRAVGHGRVVFAERYGSYGQLVVVDHGERYFTVYGGLSEMEVQVGDEVSKSARLGTAGTEPVYFEVRRGTRAQDARSWLGL